MSDIRNIDTSRLIGDSMEINGNIISMNFNSKLPKFIKNIREKYYRNKLISIVNKMNNANVPLKRSNIIELFSYILSNFPDSPSYSSKSSRLYSLKYIVKDDMEIWIAIVSTKVNDNRYKFKVRIDVNDEKKYEVECIETNASGISNSRIIEFEDSIFSSTTHVAKILNKSLTDITCTYIIDSLTKFNEVI